MCIREKLTACKNRILKIMDCLGIRHKSRTREKLNINDSLSSRIKKIYIQLHDYSFYHGPSNEDHIDRYSIGRKRIYDKLKSLFLNSEIASGAYLVTGYRGSGKTSVVNRVINEILEESKILRAKTLSYLNVLFFYIGIIIFLRLFYSKPQDISIWIWIVAMFLLTIPFIFRILLPNPRIRFTWRKKNKIKNFWLNVLRLLKYTPSFIVRENNYHFYKNTRNSFNWLAFILYPIIFTRSILWIWPKLFCSNYSILAWVCLFFYIEIFFNIIYFARERRMNIISQLKSVLEIFNLNRPVFIRLNLGYTRLSEINILRLIVRNLNTEMRNYFRKWFLAKIAVNLLLFYMVYSLVFLIYYKSGIDKKHQKIKESSGFLHYFQSQDSLYISQEFVDVQEIYNKIDCTEKSDSLVSGIYNIDPVVNKSASSLNNTNQQKSFVQFQHKTVVEFLWEKFSVAIGKYCPVIDVYCFDLYQRGRKLLFNGILLGDLFDSSKGEPKSTTKQNSINNKSALSFSMIPYHLDYFFLFYVLLTFWIIRTFMNSRMFNTTTPRMVLKKIRHLNEIIVSEVTTEIPAGSGRSTFNIFSFFSPSTKKRPIADEREIEKDLIEIFDDMHELHFPFTRPKITIVLDELDKTESLSQTITENKSGAKEEFQEHSAYIKTPNPSFTIESSRERLKALQKLLSNLKYFTSDVKAKFIFIAGRELYDASLADISDRNYFMGSIFHDVIYVNTFFSDDSDTKPSDITSLIEAYVCQRLIPEKYVQWLRKEDRRREKNDPNYQSKRRSQDYYYDLEAFNSFLIDNFDELNDDPRKHYSQYSRLVARQKREKIIHLIQQFIIYLTHASNGAPKKITNYFENFVQFIKIPKDELDNAFIVSLNNKNPRSIKRIRQRRNSYLVFGFYQQYEIGFTNYLTVPIILSFSNQNKNYGDKILVSATYLFDHLLKFHRFGFSWRNIETVPEILEINKTPELRGFVGNVINFLAKTHLQIILSGLYNFRFNRKLAYEISLLSRISEEAGAAFNFTLDESLAIKHYYFSLLYRLEERYKKITVERTDYIHSIALVLSTLGDLYYYDEEYSDAIIEYLDAVQFLRYADYSDENVSLLLILIRNMLKLGLAYEKRKTFDSAFETFNELTYLLIKQRNINIKEIGLIERKGKEGNSSLFSKDDPRYRKIEDYKNRQRYKSFYCEDRDYIKNFEENFIPESKENEKFKFDAKSFLHEITKEITPQKEKILSKISTFEGLRLIYQPLLAKLQIMEKCMLGGITETDIFRVEKEFAYLQKATAHQGRNLIGIEFYNRMGDILYFKRGYFREREDKRYHACHKNLFVKNGKVNSSNCSLKKLFESKEPDETTFFGHSDPDSNSPKPYNNVTIGCGACLFYMKSLMLFLIKISPEKIDKKDDSKKGKESKKCPFTDVYDFYSKLLKHFDSLPLKDHNSLRILAGLISDFSDVQLSNMDKTDSSIVGKVSIVFFNKFDQKDKDRAKVLKEILDFLSDVPLNNTLGIIFQYYISAMIYKMANEDRSYSWQLLKILHLLKEIFHLQKGPKDRQSIIDLFKQFIDKIEGLFANEAIDKYWNAYDSIHINVIYRYNDIFYSHPDAEGIKRIDGPLISLKRLSINTDIEETIIILARIRLYLFNLTATLAIEDKRKVIAISTDPVFFQLYFNMSSPYGNSDTMYNRLLRLRIKAEMNYLLFKCILTQLKVNGINGNSVQSNNKMSGYSGWSESNISIVGRSESFIKACRHIYSMVGNGNLKQIEKVHVKFQAPNYNDHDHFNLLDFLSFLIADSIFCLDEVIKISTAYGKSYLISNSYIASVHEKLMNWCLYRQFIEVQLQDKNLNEKDEFKNDFLKELNNRIERQIKKWIDTDTIQSLNPYYHYEMAKSHLDAALETHTEGKTYKNLIEDMSFLNDDFNDKYSHFNIAIERFFINNGSWKERMKSLNDLNLNEQKYKFEEYIKTNIQDELT